jgi:hypothetical protein
MCCTAVLLTACRKTDEQPVTEMAAAAPMIVLADLAGTWSLRSIPATGDTTPIMSEIMATADTTGWMFKFPNRPAMPMRVLAVGGDSIVTEIGPYESVLRPGVMVTTRWVTRLEGGNLVGTFRARYQTTGPDSVLTGRSVGTRMP